MDALACVGLSRVLLLVFQMQQQELAQIRQREANLTALAAIGPRKKRKMDSPVRGASAEVSNAAPFGIGKRLVFVLSRVQPVASHCAPRARGRAPVSREAPAVRAPGSSRGSASPE